MRCKILAIAAGTVLLAGCSGGGIDETVDRPITEVQALVEAAPEQALELADQLPGTDHSIESEDGRVTWHFTLHGQEYAQFVVSLTPKGPQSTQVKTSLVEMAGSTEPGVPFLRDGVEAVGEESVAAALEGRAVDMASLQRRFKAQVMADPSKVTGATAQLWNEANKFGQESSPKTLSNQPYDKRQPYDRTQPYDLSN